MIFDTDQYIGTKEYAKSVGTYPARLLFYLKKGHIPAVKFDGRWYIPIENLKMWPPAKRKMGRPRKITSGS